uniref:Uncharacterized protein n=1 Tax=Tetradesmus obliquus TaxID=3088 RepID=A0A383WB99_TETOB|eukprot:jgi/Sobl393_1/6687/SZX74482.1
MQSLLNSTDCMSDLKDTISASQVAGTVQLCSAGSGAACPADVSPLKSFSRKKQHDSPKVVSRPNSGAVAASLSLQDDQSGFNWTVASADAAAGSSSCDTAGIDDAGRQRHDQRDSKVHQMAAADVDQASSIELCDLLTAAAPACSASAYAAACQAMPVASTGGSSSKSSGRAAPPPALIVPEPHEQQQQQHVYSQYQQQHWIPRVMPAQPSPAAAAAGRMLMQPCMAAAAASLSSSISPPARAAGVRAAAALLCSGDCTPECLSPVKNTAASTSSHAAALEAALLASRLY